MKILLLGDKGQIGRDLNKKISKTNYTLSSCSKKDFDFSNYKALKSHASSFNPDIIINAAAYTKVDKAEHDKDIAFEINARLPEFLAKYCLYNEIILIHFSSDYVFSGDSNQPYKESSIMEPCNYYGYCKKQGDMNIINNHNKFFILRTSWVYSKYKENFLTKVIDSVHNSENLDIVHDQIGIPTSSEFIAKVVMNIINHNIPYGTYNVVPNGCASWHDFSSYIVDKLKDYKIKPVDIKKINSKELNLVAKRPLYSVLDNEKLKKNTNIEIKDWQYYVDQLLEEGIFDT